jgi:hypothetical protein
LIIFIQTFRLNDGFAESVGLSDGRSVGLKDGRVVGVRDIVDELGRVVSVGMN